MNVAFTPGAWEDFCEWAVNNPKIFKKTRKLIDAAQRDPSRGEGKPERLKGDLTGCWSRRITEEHRLVYYVKDENLIVIGCRHHY